MGPQDEEKPPRPGRGLLLRAAIGAFFICVFSAATVASAGLLEVDQLIRIVKNESAAIPGIEGALDNVDPGKPQTILVLGSDRRFQDIKEKNPVRSDTLLLVRLDPARGVTAVMSIPRDLKVNIRTRRGTVNDNSPPNGSQFDYATIDIDPGYQKLCGQDSLDYVRYRHFDDDLVRAARQQSFLAAAKEQIGLGRICGDRKELLRIFGRYTQTDIARDNTAAILRLLKLAFESSKNPIREVRFRGDIGETYVTIGPRNLQKTINEFRTGRASKGPRVTGGTSPGSRASRRKARRSSPGLPRGVITSR